LRTVESLLEERVMKDPTGTLAPILVVPDVEKAVDTYTRVFGFEKLRYFDGNSD
jgi:hypothetical protein